MTVTIHRMNNTYGARCGAEGRVNLSTSGAPGAVTCPDCKGGEMNTATIEAAAAAFRAKYNDEAVRVRLACGCHMISGRIAHLCIDCELKR